ncbi:MAG: AAA family ATPase [Chloroflexi bacterium]|nr:AAA family ATPase [Chloroflexota bacterium]
MECPRCHTRNRQGAHFCRRCGLLLQSSCPRCGVDVLSDSDFCDHCGYPLSPNAHIVRAGWPGEQTAVAALQSYAISPPPTEANPTTGDVTRPDLDALIPTEFKSKLDQARAEQAMVGERRIVTMLFCDVKGSTAAAEQLDPEEWTEIINGAFEHMIRPVYKYEGAVGRLLGDAVLAFFGAPIAHEDDPQRAILAGLDIVAEIEHYQEQVKRRYGVEFGVRVGINTGMVVVGGVGSDLHMEFTATGDAVNLAARMEQTAEPGTVHISEDTYKLVAPLFEFEALGSIQVKGKSEPIATYRPLYPKSRPGRVRGIEGLDSPMVGRSAELEQLQGLIRRALQGEGQIVSIMGEAGLGKSRLISEMQALWQREQNSSETALRWATMGATSYHTGRPYDSFQQQIRVWTEITANDAPEVARDKLQRMLREYPQHETLQTVHEMLLGIHPDGEAVLDGETFKRELYASMLHALRREVGDQPYVCIFDDAHWIDSASLGLEAHLLTLVKQLPVLFIFAFRPDREAPIWALRERMRVEYAERYTEIALQPLSDSHSDEMVNHLLAIADLPDALRGQILEKADGNPFYVEEIVRTLIERGIVVQDESGTYWRAIGDSENIDIPDSLQALVIARIDRLTEDVRHTLQLASVIGRSFYQRVLATIEEQQQTLDTRLAELQHMDIIVETAKLPELEYMFRHTMTQEAAYNTLLLKRRSEFHLRVGEALERLFPNRLEELAPTLAHHFDEAKNSTKALDYRIQAGDIAYRLYALQDAIDHYARALNDVEAAHVDQLLHVYRRLGRTYELIHDYASAIDLYKAMAAVGEDRAEPRLRVSALLGQALAHTVSEFIDPPLAFDMASNALALAHEYQDAPGEARALWVLMLVHMYGLNKQEDAAVYGQKALELARTLALREQMAFILSDLAINAGQLGQIQAMDAYTDEAIVLWRELDNQPMLASSLHYKGAVEQFCGNNRSAFNWAEQGFDLARRVENLYGQSGCLGVIGLAGRELGEYGRAIEALEYRHQLFEQAEGLGWAARTIELAIVYAELGVPRERLTRYYAYKSVVETLSETYRNWVRSLFAYYEMIVGDEENATETLALLQVDLSANKFENGATAWYAISKGMLAFKGQHYDTALSDLGSGLAWCRQFELEWHVPELLLWQGKAFHVSGDGTAARATWQQAKTMADRMESKRILWQVLALLAETSQDEAEKKQLKQEARVIVDSIAESIGEPELRRSFLKLPHVQPLL